MRGLRYLRSAGPAGLGAQVPRQLVPIHFRQADVEQADLRTVFHGPRQRPPRIVFDQAFHQRQSEAQAAGRPVRGTLGLGKQLEGPRHQLRRHADALIPDLDQHMGVLHLGPYLDGVASNSAR